MIGFEYICNLYNVKYINIARELGISRQTVNAWTSGRRPVAKKYIPILSKRFDDMPEEYFQKEINDLDKLYIQQKKLNNELDSNMLKEDIKIKDIKGRDRVTLKKISLISVKIKSIEIIEEIKRILQFDNINDRVYMNQVLMYLKLVIAIIQTNNFHEIWIADAISMLILYYYEPDKYKENIDVPNYPESYKKSLDNFNKTILKSIENFSKTKKI